MNFVLKMTNVGELTYNRLKWRFFQLKVTSVVKCDLKVTLKSHGMTWLKFALSYTYRETINTFLKISPFHPTVIHTSSNYARFSSLQFFCVLLSFKSTFSYFTFYDFHERERSIFLKCIQIETFYAFILNTFFLCFHILNTI